MRKDLWMECPNCKSKVDFQIIHLERGKICMCRLCDAEFILSQKYDNTKARCPYCQSIEIQAMVMMEDEEKLGILGCMAISL